MNLRWLTPRMTRLIVIATASVAIVLMAVTQVVNEPPYVVMISVDGLRADALTSPGLVLPTLRALARDGAFARGVVGVVPTITYPSHTTLVTGVTPAVHGIYTNRIFDPERRSQDAWYWYAGDVKVPSLPLAIQARGFPVAAISWPASVGLDVDFLFPEYLRTAHPELMLLWRALSRPPSLLDEVEAARLRPFPFPISDTERTALATFLIQRHHPRFLLLHLFDADSAQHEFGSDSPEARAALARDDSHLATVLQAIDATGLRSRTNVIVVSDHGFVHVSKQLQLNALFRQHGWLTADARGRVTAWHVYFQPAGGTAFIMLRDPDDASLRARVESLLQTFGADPANGIDRILTREDLRALGASPLASFAIFLKPGYYTGEANDVLWAPPVSRGGHGHDPSLASMHASFVANGPNVPALGDLGIVRMTQVAPTVAAWYDVPLSPAADTAIAFNRAGH